MANQTFTAFWLGYIPSGPGEGPLLGATPPYVDVLVLAFANLFPGNSTCTSFLQKSNTEDSFKVGIASLRQSAPNMKILMSLIGTPQPPVGWNTGISDPVAFGQWCAYVAHQWKIDGFDIDNEDLDTNPGDQFVATVKGMRAAMPNAILTLDTYLFERDRQVIGQLANDLTSINTMAYFRDFHSMTALVEQYATVISPDKISVGVKSAKTGFHQGTSLQDTAQLCKWNPSAGKKRGMMLWNVSSDLEKITGEPDGAWTKTIRENLP